MLSVFLTRARRNMNTTPQIATPRAPVSSTIRNTMKITRMVWIVVVFAEAPEQSHSGSGVELGLFVACPRSVIATFVQREQTL